MDGKTLAILIGTEKARPSNLTEAKEAIVSYLLYRKQYAGCGSTLADLNRRFGPQIHKLGGSFRDVIKEIALEGLLVARTYKRSVVVYHADFTDVMLRIENLEEQVAYEKQLLEASFG